MAETIVNIVLTLPNQNNISPKGVVALLTVIHEAIFYNYKHLLHRLFKVRAVAIVGQLREVPHGAAK